MVLEILIAILSVCGVVLLVWCISGWLLRPMGGEKMCLLFPACGDAPELEQALRGAAWLRETGLVTAEILVVDCGLSEAGQKKVSALRARMEYIRCIPRAELSEILKTER